MEPRLCIGLLWEYFSSMKDWYLVVFQDILLVYLLCLPQVANFLLLLRHTEMSSSLLISMIDKAMQFSADISKSPTFHLVSVHCT
jgi:hypothetical protein